MIEKRQYTYVVLRYRHDPLTGEFANVGVLLHEPRTRFLGVKVRNLVGRLSKMFPDLDWPTLRQSLRKLEISVKRSMQGEAQDMLSTLSDASSIAKRALIVDDSSFVWGPIGSGMTAEPSRTLENLFERFVSRYDESNIAHRDDAAVWKPVQDRLAERDLAWRLGPKTILSSLDKIEFQHAWKNGEWQCYQPLSFDLASEETIREKAAKWAGHMLALKDSTEAFKPHFVIGHPSNPALDEALRSAIGILNCSPVKLEIVDEFSVDQLVSEIEDGLRAHGLVDE
jgi:hypothetical protein